jgi:hypothetical protein
MNQRNSISQNQKNITVLFISNIIDFFFIEIKYNRFMNTYFVANDSLG